MIPDTDFPTWRSSTGRHGTNVNSRDISMSANRPLARSIGRRRAAREEPQQPGRSRTVQLVEALGRLLSEYPIMRRQGVPIRQLIGTLLNDLQTHVHGFGFGLSGEACGTGRLSTFGRRRIIRSLR